MVVGLAIMVPLSVWPLASRGWCFLLFRLGTTSLEMALLPAVVAVDFLGLSHPSATYLISCLSICCEITHQVWFISLQLFEGVHELHHQVQHYILF